MIKIKFSRFLKLFLALTLALIFFPACDCWTTIDEILPDASEVCDWDGNYIYHLNIRAKTTGTEVEPLVPQVEYEGETYNLDIDENGEIQVINNNKCLYIDNNTVLFLSNPTKKTQNPDEDQSSNRTPLNNKEETEESQPKLMIIKYLIKEKTCEILHVSYKYKASDYSIKKYDGDLGIIIIAKGDAFVFIRYLIGEEFEPLDGENKFETSLVNDTVVLIGKSAIYYGNYSQKEFTFLRKKSADEPIGIITSLNISGQDFIIIANRANCGFTSALFLNLETKKTYTPDMLTGKNGFCFIKDNLILIGEQAQYYYISTWYYHFLENAALYRIIFENDTLQFTKIKKLPYKTVYDYHEYLSDNKIGFTLVNKFYLSTEPNYNDRLADGGDKLYVYNIKNNSFTRVIKFYHENSEEEPTINCGDLTYFMESDRTSSFWIHTTVYYFKSKNNVTGEEFLNYFFSTEGDSNLNEPSLIFENYRDLSNYLILPY